MKVNINDLIKDIESGGWLKKFGYIGIRKSINLPICRWKKEDPPYNIFFENYSKNIKTRGNVITKNTIRL